jgi:RNA polymerase sigma-70 factor (ECF subfamily)
VAASLATEVRPKSQRSSSAVGALESLYEGHADRIFAFCMYQLRDRGEAEDAMQTTFLYALRALRRGVVPRSEVAWLITIAHNVCRSLRRSTRRRDRFEGIGDPHVIAEIAGRRDTEAEDLLDLDDALARMPENQRRAIVLREWHGLPYRELAATMGITQTAGEMLVFRARRSLAGELRGERPSRVAARVGQAVNAGGVLALIRSFFAGVSTTSVAAGASVLALAAAGGSAPSQVVLPRQPVHPVSATKLSPASQRTAEAVRRVRSATVAPAGHVPFLRVTPPSPAPALSEPAPVAAPSEQPQVAAPEPAPSPAAAQPLRTPVPAAQAIAVTLPSVPVAAALPGALPNVLPPVALPSP